MPSDFEQRVSKWQPIVFDEIKALKKSDTATLLNNIPIKRSTLYYTLKVLEARDAILKEKLGRLNQYSLANKYQEYTYTLRVIETNTANPRHKWDADVEATISGVAPIGMNEKAIADSLRDELFDNMLKILTSQTPPVLTIPKDRIMIDDFGAKGISGVELKNAVDKFDSRNEIEVVFTNNIGRIYDRGEGYTKILQRRISEWF